MTPALAKFTMSLHKNLVVQKKKHHKRLPVTMLVTWKRKPVLRPSVEKDALSDVQMKRPQCNNNFTF